MDAESFAFETARMARVAFPSGGFVTEFERGNVGVGCFLVVVVAESTTAAGDAFIGGFASALLQDKSLEEAVRYGCACGALATTKFGAQPSLPTKEDVERFLRQRPITNS